MPDRLCRAVDLLVLALLYFVVLRRCWSARGRKSLAVHTLLYFYLVGVLYVTLMPILTALPDCLRHPYRPMHLLPFRDLYHGYGDAERQLLLNVLMTVPFGFLVPLRRRCVGKKCSFFRCLLLTSALSLSIELLQPLLSMSRRSDITDVITNTVGGLIGYGLYLLTRPLTKRLTDG